MPHSVGPIYEVTVSVDREIADAFDAWLAEHVREMLDIPGFLKSETFEIEDDDAGRVRRVTHYYLASEEELENYLAGPANAMRQSGIDRFEDKFVASRRVLRRKEESDEELRQLPSCLNCGTSLSGQYCGNCGQRARNRLISLWELIREAFGDLLELDSRLWQTLGPLLVRPGKLTRDYLLGRRARFMPPFRTYLVLSVVFFLVAFFNPREEFNVLFEPASETAEVAEPAELAEEGIVVDDDALPDEEEESNGINIDLTSGESDEEKRRAECDAEDINTADIPDWLSSRLTPERLQLMCERVLADDGRALFGKLRDNVPVALFVLLPLMALVLKITYPLSKRYYVEHLLFVVHYHAFVFLMLTLQVLFARFGALISIPESAIDAVLMGAALYIPAYLFRSMQRVYGQGVLITVVKYVFLLLSYFFGFILMIGIAAMFAAFSI
jgi:Protein of unknown function (DUF3667)/Domain of unknown function (DUF4286)